MKRKTIKAKIAAALSASMVATVLAPAMPAMAATPGPDANGFKIDFRSKNEAKVPFVKDLFIGGGTAGNPIAADYKGMKYDAVNQVLFLPFLETTAGAFDASNAPTASLDAPGAEATQSWVGLGLDGYMITGYVDAPANGRNTSTVNPARFPMTGLTYYATLGPDPAKTFNYEVKHNYETGTTYIPGISPGEIADNAAKPVLTPVTNAIPKNVPGYKVSRVEATVGTETLGTSPLPSLSSNLYITSDKRVSGVTTNKPFKADYYYDRDTSKNFNIRVFDAKYRSSADITAGNAPETNQQRSSANISAPVLTDVASGTYNVAANTGIIGDGSSADETMYILDSTNPVTITYAKGKPAATAGTDISGDAIAVGQFTSDGTGTGTGKVIKTIIPAADVAGAYTSLTPDASSTTGGAHPRNTFKLTGNMPNQNVTVTYNYVPNPAFTTNIRVMYVDQLGNNITDKVVTALGLGAEPSGAGVPRTFYKENVAAPTYIYVKANTLQTGETSYNLDIPAPVLDTYGGSPAVTGVSNPKITADDPTSWSGSYTTALDNTFQASWSQSSPKFTVNTTGPLRSQIVYVTYEQDPGSIAYLAYSAGTGGDLKTVVAGNTVDWDPTAPGQSIPNVTKQNIQPDGSYDVVIDPNSATSPTKMPDAVPNQGYSSATWYYGTTAITSFPTTLHIPAGSSTVVLMAKFEKNPANWVTYNLAAGNNHVQLLLGTSEDVLNIDASGNPRAITLGDLQSAALGSGAMVDSGYTIKWFDQSWNEIDYTTDITALAGQTLTALGVSITPASVYQPTVTGELDPTTAAPMLSIDPSSPASIDPTLQYIVTDPSGNVVKVVSGSRLLSTGGQITDPAFAPGNTYNVSVAPATATGIAVGSPIPSSAGAGAPGTAQIPVALTPQVTEDSANPGRAVITITPTTANTDYALVDPSGNEVYPFTTPSAPGAPVVFGNLDPNTVYRVVPRTTGTNATPASRIADGAALPVDTANGGLTVTAFDVTVYIPGGIAADPSPIKVDGVIKSSLNDLKNLRRGALVEIMAQPLDINGNLFKEWQAITGIGNSDLSFPTGAGSGRVVFTMPNRPVTIQPLYDNNQNWATQYNDNIGSGKQISAGFPVTIADTGDFRILIEKDNVPAATLDAVVDHLSDSTFKGIFQMKIVVQKKDSAGNWQDYTDPSGNPIPLSTDIVTGALMAVSREYRFFEVGSIATPSSAGAVTISDINVPEIKASNASNYQGQFTQTLESGKMYVFGYTSLINAYKVTVKDARDNSIVTKLTIGSTNTVNDYASMYASAIQADYIDNDGITWHYEGLSKERARYDAYDPTLRVTADETIYIYYSNDKEARRKAESDLKAGIQNAINQLSKITDPAKRAALQAAIDAAQAVVDKMNRKSSTAELIAALDALNQAVKDAGGKTYEPDNNKGGGGSRGGRGGSGGGSSSGSGKRVNYDTKILTVGQDGNWELINPDEAAGNLNKSKWKFNLKTGGNAKGWAYLSYTFEGKTKSEWYHFGEDGVMNSGWFVENGRWYYLSMDHNGFYGEMIRGWHFESQDSKWYYLNPSNGSMHTDWLKDGNEFYYLNPTAQQQTWFYDNETDRWNFGHVNSRPYGSMYQNETTPDGYTVNENGAWR